MGGKYMVELTDVEQKIFDKVQATYKERGVTKMPWDFYKKIIKMANTNGDGFKRVSRIGEDKTYLVPIETIILCGLREQDLDKYPTED